jgi:hypothetical protein
MNIDILYILSFFISLIILHIYNSDFKKISIKLYNSVNNIVKIKIYCLITIYLIHSIWLFSSIFLNYNDNNYIYGFPLYLIILYIIFIYSEYIEEKNSKIESETEITVQTNKYLNYIFSIYIITLIIFIIIPDNFKIDFINLIKNFIKKILKF